MRLILIGCEYSGTTSLAETIQEWTKETLGSELLIHDHWKLPHASGHPPSETITNLTDQEMRQVLGMTPKLKELLTRYALHYHTPFMRDSSTTPGGIFVGYYVDEMVYGPLYFDYGGPSEPGDREIEARIIEQRITEYAPETVLVLVKTQSEIIAQRMSDKPHAYSLVGEQDIEHVLRRFEEEYAGSTITNKFALDTSDATLEETLQQFLEKMEPFWTESDRLRMLTHLV